MAIDVGKDIAVPMDPAPPPVGAAVPHEIADAAYPTQQHSGSPAYRMPMDGREHHDPQQPVSRGTSPVDTPSAFECNTTVPDTTVPRNHPPYPRQSPPAQAASNDKEPDSAPVPPNGQGVAQFVNQAIYPQHSHSQPDGSQDPFDGNVPPLGYSLWAGLRIGLIILAVSTVLHWHLRL